MKIWSREMREISEGEERAVKVNEGAHPWQSAAEAGASSEGAGPGGREAGREPAGGSLRGGGLRGGGLRAGACGRAGPEDRRSL